LAAKTGSEDDAVKAITGVESENKARSSVPFDEVTSVVQSDKISSSPPDEASTAATSADKTLTPDQCVFSAPQLLPLLDQVNHNTFNWFILSVPRIVCPHNCECPCKYVSFMQLKPYFNICTLIFLKSFLGQLAAVKN